MLEIKIKTKSDLVKAINAVSIKKIQTRDISNNQDLNDFMVQVKTLISTSGKLTLIAIKE